MLKEKKFYLTKQGFEKLKKEYKSLNLIKSAKIKGEIPQILHSEDVNLEHLIFQEDIIFLNSRIIELENIIKNSELIKTPKKEKQNIVDLGATVTLEETDGQLNEFMIIGTLEANPGEGKISSESPVGKSLLGRRIGEEVIITSPIKIVYKIKKIKYRLD